MSMSLKDEQEIALEEQRKAKEAENREQERIKEMIKREIGDPRKFARELEDRAYRNFVEGLYGDIEKKVRNQIHEHPEEKIYMGDYCMGLGLNGISQSWEDQRVKERSARSYREGRGYDGSRISSTTYDDVLAIGYSLVLSPKEEELLPYYRTYVHCNSNENKIVIEDVYFAEFKKYDVLGGFLGTYLKATAMEFCERLMNDLSAYAERIGEIQLSYCFRYTSRYGEGKPTVQDLPMDGTPVKYIEPEMPRESYKKHPFAEKRSFAIKYRVEL